MRQQLWVRDFFVCSGGLMNPSKSLRHPDIYHEISRLHDAPCDEFPAPVKPQEPPQSRVGTVLTISKAAKHFQTLSGIVKQLVFVAQTVTLSTSFQRFIVEDILPHVLAAEFRSNPRAHEEIPRGWHHACCS
jgi:hypothetical protein